MGKTRGRCAACGFPTASCRWVLVLPTPSGQGVQHSPVGDGECCAPATTSQGLEKVLSYRPLLTPHPHGSTSCAQQVPASLGNACCKAGLYGQPPLAAAEKVKLYRKHYLQRVGKCFLGGKGNLKIWFSDFSAMAYLSLSVWLQTCRWEGCILAGYPQGCSPSPGLSTCQHTLSGSEFTRAVHADCTITKTKPILTESSIPLSFWLQHSSKHYLNWALILICRIFTDFNQHWCFIEHNYYFLSLLFTGTMNSYR